ncbi:MAG: hypothetical protein ABFQ95_07510 [Pseudomonadota bacterium]
MDPESQFMPRTGINRVDLLLDVFVWAYERSTLRYSEARAYLMDPDPFIENYDADIRNIIRQVVDKKQSKKIANNNINDWAQKHIPESDQARFIEVVETELLLLHEGNIAKFKIKPVDFYAWQTIW